MFEWNCCLQHEKSIPSDLRYQITIFYQNSTGTHQVKFTITKSCLARFSGVFASGTPSNIHDTAISYRCAKFGAFVNSVMILTLRDLTKGTKKVLKNWKVKTMYFWNKVINSTSSSASSTCKLSYISTLLGSLCSWFFFTVRFRL